MLTSRSYGGKDITSILADDISHHHSDAAYEILGDYHVGFLPQSYIPTVVGGKMPPSPPRTPRTPSIYTATGMDPEEELSITTDIASDFKTHKFLDLSKPLLMQVWGGGFSKEFYLEQVHKPRHYKGGESAPLFGNFLEPLSKTPWWVVPIVWLPWISYGLYRANEGMENTATTASWAVLGLCIWSLVEYGMHRCLFHVDE